eukprot:Platyproteum_vivax@DN12575_c0_g1_i1.p1
MSQHEPEDAENLWRKYGYETEAGRVLYDLYAKKNPPKIHYPPVKTKPWSPPTNQYPKKPPVKINVPKLSKAKTPPPKAYRSGKRTINTILSDPNFFEESKPQTFVPTVDREVAKDRLIESFQASEAISLPAKCRLPKLEDTT